MTSNYGRFNLDLLLFLTFSPSHNSTSKLDCASSNIRPVSLSGSSCLKRYLQGNFLKSTVYREFKSKFFKFNSSYETLEIMILFTINVLRVANHRVPRISLGLGCYRSNLKRQKFLCVFSKDCHLCFVPQKFWLWTISTTLKNNWVTIIWGFQQNPQSLILNGIFIASSVQSSFKRVVKA